MSEKLKLSPLPHTWLLDLDGTLLKHNGYLTGKGDILLPGVRVFMASLPAEDVIILLTSRNSRHAEETENFLRSNDIRYNHIIYDLPYGERILVNDAKSSGLATALAICGQRNAGFPVQFEIDESL